MPSPFPGMDPYLESPVYWRGFHNALITEIMRALNSVLPPGFAANAEERVYVLPQERTAVPDVSVRKPSRVQRRPSHAGTAVMAPTPPDGEVTAYPEEQREPFVEIRATDDWEKVITVIEVLSPANKSLEGAGRDEYLRKQQAVLNSETHLVEVDLLLGGRHTVAAPLQALRKRGKWDYLVSLHRSTQRYTFHYWFCSLRKPLPIVSIPLTADADDAPLDLQACFTGAYDAGPYSRSMDYRNPPPVPVPGTHSAWLKRLMQTYRSSC